MLSDKYSSVATLKLYQYEKDRFSYSLCFIRLLIGCCYVGRGALMEERYLTFQSPRMKNGFTPNIAWS